MLRYVQRKLMCRDVGGGSFKEEDLERQHKLCNICIKTMYSLQ